MQKGLVVRRDSYNSSFFNVFEGRPRCNPFPIHNFHFSSRWRRGENMCSKLNLMILMVLHVFAQSHNSLFSPRPYRMARLSTVASCTPEDDHRWHSLGSKNQPLSTGQVCCAGLKRTAPPNARLRPPRTCNTVPSKMRFRFDFLPSFISFQ